MQLEMNMFFGVYLMEPTVSQIGKTIYIVAFAPSAVLNLTGSTPTVSNSTKLTTIPIGKRITIFGIAANTFANLTNEWVVIAKDF